MINFIYVSTVCYISNMESTISILFEVLLTSEIIYFCMVRKALNLMLTFFQMFVPLHLLWISSLRVLCKLSYIASRMSNDFLKNVEQAYYDLFSRTLKNLLVLLFNIMCMSSCIKKRCFCISFNKIESSPKRKASLNQELLSYHKILSIQRNNKKFGAVAKVLTYFQSYHENITKVISLNISSATGNTAIERCKLISCPLWPNVLALQCLMSVRQKSNTVFTWKSYKRRASWLSY